MVSIKGHNNSTMAWKPCEADPSIICTRSFQKLNETPHFKFCKTFFEHGEKEALKIENYCRVNLKSHRDLFDHLPKELDREPIWWLMPWGGTMRQPDFNKERRKEIKRHYSAKFIELLKSIEKNGFVIDEKFRPPVHQLIKGEQTAYILQDGHHRSAIFSYIVENGCHNLLKFQGKNQANKIKVQNLLILRYKFLPHLKYTKIGTNQGHFSLRDTLKWFDLAFQVLDLETKTTEYALDYRLSILHDKLIKKMR